ncbi:MAG: DsbA family protein [Mesorhizobium sp.]|nr:DsbA family protein [Mesorhizobium sp.]
MSERLQVTVDVVSDVVCPWCFIGQKRLDKAVASLPEIDVAVHWRPFQLDPTIPPEGKDRKAYMLAKFGSEEKLRQIHDRIVPLGAADGIDFHFEKIKIAANTLDAHRVIRWAASAGDGVQDRVTRALFSANFEQGVYIGDKAELARIAGENGMDEAVVADLLATDADKDAVQAEIENAQRMGVSGVPFFVLDGKYAVSGAQDAATLADAIRQVAGMKVG